MMRCGIPKGMTHVGTSLMGRSNRYWGEFKHVLRMVLISRKVECAAMCTFSNATFDIEPTRSSSGHVGNGSWMRMLRIVTLWIVELALRRSKMAPHHCGVCFRW